MVKFFFQPTNRFFVFLLINPCIWWGIETEVSPQHSIKQLSFFILLLVSLYASKLIILEWREAELQWQLNILNTLLIKSHTAHKSWSANALRLWPISSIADFIIQKLHYYTLCLLQMGGTAHCRHLGAIKNYTFITTNTFKKS